MQVEQLLVLVLKYELLSRSWLERKSSGGCRDGMEYCGWVELQLHAFGTRFSPFSTLPELENLFQL